MAESGKDEFIRLLYKLDPAQRATVLSHVESNSPRKGGEVVADACLRKDVNKETKPAVDLGVELNLSHEERQQIRVLVQPAERTLKPRKIPLSESRACVVDPLLEKKGWNTSEWAKKAGLDWHVADKYRKGGNISADSRAALAKAFGISPTDLPR